MKTKERGAALVVALVLLLLLTLLGTDSIQNSILDMHLSMGFKDQNHAFQSAETGLRLAENLLEGTISQAAATSALAVNNIAIAGETDYVDYANPTYWNGIDVYGGEHQVKIVVKPWRFVPDSLGVGMGTPTGINYYRITARGTDQAYEAYLKAGNSEDERRVRSLVVLQSIYAVRHTN